MAQSFVWPLSGTAAPASINAALGTFDGNGQLVPQSAGTVVRFNEKVNRGFTATNPTQGITLAPESFNDQSSQYRLTVRFGGLVLPSGGSYEVTLWDVSRLTSAVTRPIS